MMTQDQRHSGGWLVGLMALAMGSIAMAGVTASNSQAGAPRQNDGGLVQVRAINRQINQGWTESELSPSPVASDGEFCRRLHLDLIGRIPSIDELDRYLADRKPDKQLRLAQRLLYDEAYQEEFARHWATIWCNLLIGRTGGQERNSPVSREGMLEYLRDAFAHNTPYDRLVHELISATGTNLPGTPAFNGAVNFLAGKLDDRAAQATAQSARIFLGMQVQCTQCHNHPFNEWKQNQYWQMNSFFRQARVLRRFEPGTRNVRFVELTNEDFAGEDSPIEPETARVYYELRNGRLESAYPVFVDGTKIGVSGLLDDVNRREELADLIIRSESMPQAIVNRMWAHFLGYGFTKPVDDMGPHNRPVYPELLDYLADELKSNSYDLRQLMSWIVLSQPYSLSSRTTKRNAVDDPELGEPPRFSHFYVRQMTAEQLYESLLLASDADKTHRSQDKQEKARNDWLRQFTIAFGTDEGDETTTFDGTITQTLMMFNGDLMRRATSAKEGGFLHQLTSNRRGKYGSTVTRLFKAAVARRPTKSELRMAQQLLISHGGDNKLALQDLWWALLNSNEFILNH